MSRNSKPDLTPNEWKVMQIVWELKSCAARDVYEIAGQRFGWAPTTTKTYLSLLVAKGRLSTRKVGNSYLYKPKAGLLRSLQHAADGLMAKMLGNQHGPLLAYMIKQSTFSAEDIAELRQVLREAEQQVQNKERRS